MKIVHLTFSMQLGGIETMLVNIVNEQCQTDDVCLMMLNDDFDETIISKVNPQVKVVNIGRKLGSKNPFDIVKLNYILYSKHPDIIHIHHPSLIRLIAKNIILSEIVFTMHDIPLPDDLPFLSKYKNICAISNSVKTALWKYGYKSNLVENGINVNSFEKKHLGQDSIFNIIQVGRLIMRKKGQDITIRAVKRLIENGKKNIHLDIIGDGQDVDYLKRMIVELQLSNYVSLLGSRTQEWLHHHYKDYSLFIQPSRFEGFGLTVAEAMAAKVPVLVSNQEGPMEIIGNGKYGFCFKTDDVDDCYLQIEKIMAMDNINDMIAAAYYNVETKYNIKRTAIQYLDYYKKLISGSNDSNF